LNGPLNDGMKQDENSTIKMTDEIEEDMFSRESDSDEEDKDITKKKLVGNENLLGGLALLKKDVDPDEEAKFLKNMEELKKKKRKLDEDLNEFDFQKLGKNTTSKSPELKSITLPSISTTKSTTTSQTSTSTNKIGQLNNKPLSPPTSVVGGGGTYIQTEGSPKRRR